MLPKRIRNHIIETKSEKYLIQQIPDEWIYERKQYDYGIDYEVEIFKDFETTGKKFLVQLKAHENIEITDKLIRQQIKVSTLNYYLSLNQNVLIINYCVNTKRAFYFIINKHSPEYLDLLNPKWKRNKQLTLIIPADDNALFNNRYGFFENLVSKLFDEKENEIIIRLQTINYSNRINKQKNLDYLKGHFLNNTNDKINLAILQNDSIFTSANQEIKDKLIRDIYSNNIDIVISSIDKLKYFIEPDIVEVLIKRYNYLHNYQQSEIDWGKFKACVSNVIEVVSYFKRIRTKQLTNILYMEFVDPLRNWTGEQAGNILLNWWPDLSQDEIANFENGFRKNKQPYHTFEEHMCGIDIIKHVIRNDYNESLK